MRASHRAVRRSAVVISSVLLAITVLPSSVAGATSHGARLPVAVAGPTGPTVDSPVQPIAAQPAAPAAEDTTGSWGPVLDWGFQGKHMVALPTGKVLVWSTGDNARVWDPATNTFTPVPATFGDLHCAGQSTLADGRVVVVGGQNGSPHNGTAVTALFDPFSLTWTQGPPMHYLRWYATSTTLPDGRVLATSGDAPDGTRAPNPEIYDPVANTWTVLTGAPRTQGLYPLMFVLPNGKIYESGPGASTSLLTTTGTGSWAAGPTNAYSTNGYSESAVMLSPGVILRAGGGDPASNQTARIDMNAASPTWQSVAKMNFPRRRMNLTILADGTAIALGGTRASDDANQAVLEAEIWNGTTWTTVAAMAEARMYHSSAVLLDDGRVLIAGGEAAGRLRAQIYSPPYLFKGPRPTISSAPSAVGYGSAFNVGSPDAASVVSVGLIRQAAATHAFDQNQRFVPLTFSQNGSNLSVTAPANGNIAPPGYYLLVIKDANGVPSVARHVKIDSIADLQPGTIQGHVTDAGSGLPAVGITVATPGVSPATTDADGAYSLTGVAAGDHQVTFSGGGYANVVRSQTVIAGGTFTIDVALALPGDVSGRVYDVATGTSIAGATVTFPGGSTTTDAGGQYTITGLPAGAQPMSAAAIGFVSANANPTVVAGSSVTQDFALTRSATYITGEVRDALTTNTIAGATVETSVNGGQVSVLTDSLGRYKIDVPPGTYDVTASASGYPPITEQVIVTAGAYGSMDFSLLRTGATKVVNAAADAFLKGSSPTKNYGNDPSLRVRSASGGSAYSTYLKFNVTGLLGRPVTSAQIRLFTTDASPDGGHVFVAGNGWTETAITFNNAPPTVGSQIGTLGAVTNGVWAELNLPPGTVTGEGSYTFAIVGQHTNSAYYSSRQGASPPELDLILGAAPSGPPVAGMTAAPTTGPAPLTVTFADASTGGPTSWAWDFGDGTSSTAQFPPAHVYTNAGTYTVSLVASNANGPSAPATRTITVNPVGPPPPGGNPIKTMTFEGTSLTDPVTGADKISGAPVRETANPIVGAGSVTIPNLSSGYLDETFTAAADAYVAFDLRLNAKPTGSVRIVFFSDQGTTVGNLQLQASGALRLRNGSSTIGVDSAPLVVGTVYRVGLHQKRSTGANGVLQAYVAPAGSAFGTPFASLSTGTWTTLADRLRFGATAGSAVDMTADTIALDAGAMPGPIAASAAAGTLVAARNIAPVAVSTVGVSVQTGTMFDCMIPFSSLAAPAADGDSASRPAGPRAVTGEAGAGV
ncbi:MAG TPA: carboxypeptidase regulatory-like domain-containing protein [Patescibacteria group bacterium]|nr:carboxypeptidase regulatory-like domain-containing protein [Patescibacteria group bacterium]